MDFKKIAVNIFKSSIESVLPENLIKTSLKIENSTLSIENDKYKISKIHVFGSGKASVRMAKAVEDILFDKIEEGIVVCNYTEKLKKIKVIEGSHPIPTEKSIKAGEILLNEISKLSENDFFIYLLSGGSSALIEKPVPPITLKDLEKTTELLLKHSVPIDEINVIRKHLSQIKGGRLGSSTKAKGIVLVISDVVGDDLETIGSAPLYFDRSTYKDAFEILNKHNIWEKLPDAVKKVIEKGLKGEIPDTPKKPNPNIKHYIIGNNFKALTSARKKAEEYGLKAKILTSQIQGEAKEVAKVIISIGKEIEKTGNPFEPPACLLFGGETTVNVKGNGKGGRNQEMTLSALKEIKEDKNLIFLSGGTDGIDGNSDAAGAVADYRTYIKAKEKNINIDEYLKNNDSYHFFKETGDLIITGKTGTNVMDITILIIRGE
jgi:hydroxypyruvate reductase/glycerate 2-kinase